MYLESIDLSFIQPCTTDSKRIRIMSNLNKNISDIFPYLNSYIKTGIYNKKANTFVFNKEQIIITIFEDSINVAKLLNETEAFEVLDYLKDLINEVDKNRDKITPNYEIRKLPSPIEIYTYLPKLNCKKCGCETCLAFATKFVKGETSINKCIHLKEEGNERNLEKLKTYEELGINVIAYVPLSLIVITPLFISYPPYFYFGQFLLFLCAASACPCPWISCHR